MKYFSYVKITFFSLILTSILVGCSKWLELKPRDGIVSDAFWATKEQVDAAVNGIYASLLAGNGGDNRSLVDYMFVWGEARGDMVEPGFRASADELNLVNLNILPTNGFTNWANIYETINYCNVVIDNAGQVLSRDNTFNQDHLNRSIGQALAIRGLMYFYLVRTFRDVPLKLKATNSDDDISPIAKTSGDSILNQIVTDLTTAETLVPTTYSKTSAYDKGRVTKYGVNAMLADVYLWMENYSACVTQCDKVIASGQYGLVPGGSFFTQLFLNGASSESIFELQFDQQILNPFYNMQTPSNKRWGAAQYVPETVFGVDLTNAIPQVDYRGPNASYRNADYTIWKYVGADNLGDAIRTLDQSDAPWILYRYADILLLKAEALNQLDEPLEASRLVKRIRERANALELTTMDSTDKSSMTTYILNEREREFAYEGKRWFDLLRNAKRNNYENLNILITAAELSVPQSMQQAAFNKLRDQNSHYLPIFNTELQSNSLLIQNPYYR